MGSDSPLGLSWTDENLGKNVIFFGADNSPSY